MYSLGQLRRGVRRGLSNPGYFGRQVNRLYYRRRHSTPYNPGGVDVPAADWDTLVVLDACRYDVFADRHTLPGRLERKESAGAHTVEFLGANFEDREFLDTVYVSASPMLYRWQEDADVEFHDVIDVWREDGWHGEYGTVLPETTTEYALRAHEQYPNKRVIVHYLQPHYPFIGADEQLNPRLFGAEDSGNRDIWQELMVGDLDFPTSLVWEAYCRNLDVAMPAVEELIEAVDGRTVVTADHGNMFGERARPVPVREWGHPIGLYTPELVTVPWLVHDSGPRRTVVAETPQADDHRPTEDVTEQLAQLGYVDD